MIITAGTVAPPLIDQWQRVRIIRKVLEQGERSRRGGEAASGARATLMTGIRRGLGSEAVDFLARLAGRVGRPAPGAGKPIAADRAEQTRRRCGSRGPTFPGRAPPGSATMPDSGYVQHHQLHGS